MSKFKTNIIKFLGICIIGLCAMSNKVYANDQKGSSPEFYGTTNITILVGDELDLEKSFYRIFAKDYEDGNITKKIKVKSNNVKTDKIGEYSIEYEVEDSDGNITSKIVPVQVVELGKNRRIQRTLYTLPDVSKMQKAEFYRGNMQDKQDLGIYLPKGVGVKVRQIVNNGSKLTVEFYNDDELKESVACSSGSIGSKGDQEDRNFISKYDIKVESTDKIIPSNIDTSVDLRNVVSVKYKEKTLENKQQNWSSWSKYDKKSFDSVPFVKTLYGVENNPIIEIILNDDIKPLDYYTYGDSQKKFKNNWRSSGNGFAVIEGSRVTFLVPRKDLEELGVSKKGTDNKFRNDNFKSIKDILSYYDNIIEEFDEYIGLSYTTENNINKNVKTKYFIKSNIHGIGMAAYAYWKYTYMSTDSLSVFMHNEDDGWAPLHEIGHGYQGYFKNREGLELREVSNNFLAYYYQKEKLGENWFSGYEQFDKRIIEGIRKKQESYLIKNGNNNQGIDGIDVYKIRLFAFVNLLDKIGAKDSLAYLYSSYRDLVNKNIINVNDSIYDGSNLIAEKFSESSKYNVIPYLEEWKLSIDEDIKSEIYYKDYEMLYFLRDLVKSDQKAEQIKKDLGLQWNYSLVLNKDLSKYSLKGNINININRTQFEALKGYDIVLKSGKSIVKQVKVDRENFTMENLPIGIYEIETTNSKKFITSPRYVIVTQGVTKNFEIQEVEDKILKTIAVTQKPNKVKYIEGEKFDTTGMKVVATYNDGSIKEICDSDYIVEFGNSLVVGQMSVGISYTEDKITKKVTQTISVDKKQISKICIKKAPDKTEYIEGEKFEAKGMKVVVTYNNGDTKEINESEYVVKYGDSLSSGQKSVIISYTEDGITQTIAQEIDVDKKKIAKISIKKDPDKIEYIEGEKFDAKGMKVVVIYNNGDTKEINESEYVVKYGDSLSSGQKSVIISYTEDGITQTIAQEIDVDKKKIAKISIKKDPDKIEYIEGEKFDAKGMKVVVTYNNGDTKELSDSDYIIESGDSLTLEQENVIITYTEDGITQTIKQKINVYEKLKITVEDYEEIKEEGKKYITDIKPGEKIQGLKANIKTNGEIKVYKGNTEITDQVSILTTGMMIKITLRGQEINYALVVTGDLNGDGQIGNVDLLKIARYNAGLDKSLEGVYLKAADVYRDGNYADNKDLLKIARVLAGLDNL